MRSAGSEILTWRRTPRLLVGVVLIAAAFAKTGRVHATGDSILATFGVSLANGVGDAAALALIAWESCLGAALIFAGLSSRVVLLGVVTILLFTVALLRHLIVPTGQSCGCGLFFDSHGGSKLGTVLGLIRNLGLLWLLLWPAFGRSGTHQEGPATPPIAGAAQQRAAFSLVELLVAICAVTVLLAILVPTIRGARERAREAARFSDLRQAAAALDAYAGDFKNAWPFLQTPGDFNGPVTVRGVQVSWSYFASGQVLWANLICPSYLDTPQLFIHGDMESLARRNIVDGWEPTTIRSRILLSAAAFARPEWWADDVPPQEDALFSGTRHTDVVHPARKGVLLIVPAAAGESPFEISRADGSALLLPQTVNNGERLVERWRWGVPTRPVQSTRNGWRGIDPGL